MAKSKVREVLKSDDSFKEKIHYLWGYYKWAVILGIFLLILAGYSINEFLNRPQIDFHVTVLREELQVEEEEELNQQLTEEMDVPNEALVSFTPSQEVAAERFIAQWTAQEYDVILLDEDQFERYTGEGTMKEIRSISGVPEEALTSHESYDHPIAIDSNQFPLFEEFETTQDVYVLVPENTVRPDKVEAFFESQGISIEFGSE